MLLDYSNGRIQLIEGQDESFIEIQDKSKFVLCHKLEKGRNYTVPYVALPELVRVCKEIGYPLSYSDALKKIHRERSVRRAMMESIKTGSFPQTPEVIQMLAEIDRIQHDYGFQLQPDQLTTVVYGLIGRRVVIANDIGTGKTLCANTMGIYLLRTGQIRKVLIMLPASLTTNFYEDYKKFFGDEGIVLVSSQPKAKRQDLYRQYRCNDNIKFLIVNYEKCNFDFEEMKQLQPGMLVVDEFHIMKNFLSAQRSINFFSMLEDNWNVKFRYPMSGSPIENRLQDLFPIFKLVDTGYILGGQRFFELNFVEYKKRYLKIGGRLRIDDVPCGLKNEGFLHSLIRPMIIRKNISLPYGKYPTNIIIQPSKELLDTYQDLKMKYTGSSLRYHASRQFLCDTRREGYEHNPKTEELLNIIDQSSDSKIVVFSFYKCTMAYLAELFEKRGISYLECSGRTTEDPFTTVKRFREGNYKVLIATDRVNFGHNIQFAKYLINWEVPIKPTIYEQRAGRLYRTGVKHDVHIYTFIIAKTVEERIYEQYLEKKDVIKKVVEVFNDKQRDDFEKTIERDIMKEFED